MKVTMQISPRTRARHLMPMPWLMPLTMFGLRTNTPDMDSHFSDDLYCRRADSCLPVARAARRTNSQVSFLFIIIHGQHFAMILLPSRPGSTDYIGWYFRWKRCAAFRFLQVRRLLCLYIGVSFSWYWSPHFTVSLSQVPHIILFEVGPYTSFSQ